jgi:hypothetical protein
MRAYSDRITGAGGGMMAGPQLRSPLACAKTEGFALAINCRPELCLTALSSCPTPANLAH